MMRGKIEEKNQSKKVKIKKQNKYKLKKWRSNCKKKNKLNDTFIF